MCITTAQLIESFHAHLAVRVATGQASQVTALWYRPPLAKLARAVGSMPANAVRHYHLVGIDCTNAFVRATKALYKWGIDEEFPGLVKDPLRKLKVPPCGQRSRTLSRAEVARLYRAAVGTFRTFLFIQFHTLARPGEVRQLRWRDVRLDDRLIVLTAFKSKDKRRDGKAIRAIPLDAPVARMLATWHARRRPAPDDFVFCGRYGNPWTSNALRCRMRRARVVAGLDGGEEWVVCYTLRHTGATHATRAGMRDRLLADVMGHTKTATTARYQHLDPSDLVAGIDRLRRKPPKSGPGGTDPA